MGTTTSESTVQNGTRRIVRHPSAPGFGCPQRILVTDHERRPDLVAEAHYVGAGPVSDSNLEADAAPPQRGRQFRQALDEKLEVPEVRRRKARIEDKERHDRPTEEIGHRDGGLERGIVGRPLGPLHPADDRAALWIRHPRAAHRDARVVDERRQGRWKLMLHTTYCTVPRQPDSLISRHAPRPALGHAGCAKIRTLLRYNGPPQEGSRRS